ncbi:MAG: DUF5063 domain-containing protein [Bacteroidales bacterium]|nr:DUF5063 domain-containing protein [Bacteroidales bacterium]
MFHDKNLLYGKDTIEFVTVALEFCSLMEKVRGLEAKELVDKCSKILPLLYLKAILLPPVALDDNWELEESVTEDGYNYLRNGLAHLLGEQDIYLVTFHQEMKYSDTPIAASIAEDLADIYQDLANFLFIYRDGVEQYMGDALAKCRYGFDEYWGMKLLNCLGALHSLREIYGLSSLSSDDGQMEEDIYEE